MSELYGQPLVNVYPSENYKYGSKTAKTEKSRNAQAKLSRM